MMMRRFSTMTLGFVLILLGIQLNIVQSYELTPRFSNFLSDSGGRAGEVGINPSGFESSRSPYRQASFNNEQAALNLSHNSGSIRTITTPRWLCWPFLFLGVVVFLHGLGKPVNQ